MTEIRQMFVPEMRANPKLLLERVESGAVSADEALCCMAHMLNGETLSGMIRAQNFRQYWESQIFSGEYKASLLASAAPEHLDMVKGQIEKEVRDILEETALFMHVLKERLPELWSRIDQESEIIWAAPVNLNRERHDDESAAARFNGSSGAQRKREKHRDPKPMTGQLGWSDPDAFWGDFDCD